MLMVGPPGSGKSMLASRLVTLLPELPQAQALELASIYSVAGKPLDVARLHQTKLVNPHHSASTAAMVGGGCHFSLKLLLFYKRRYQYSFDRNYTEAASYFSYKAAS